MTHPGESGASSLAPNPQTESIEPAKRASAKTPHRLECEVKRTLLNQPNLEFSSLVVRRIPQGVCLQGVLECSQKSDPDVASLAQKVAGVERVLNRVVVKRRRSVPPKG